MIKKKITIQAYHNVSNHDLYDTTYVPYGTFRKVFNTDKDVQEETQNRVSNMKELISLFERQKRQKAIMTIRQKVIMTIYSEDDGIIIEFSLGHRNILKIFEQPLSIKLDEKVLPKTQRELDPNEWPDFIRQKVKKTYLAGKEEIIRHYECESMDDYNDVKNFIDYLKKQGVLAQDECNNYQIHRPLKIQREIFENRVNKFKNWIKWNSNFSCLGGSLVERFRKFFKAYESIEDANELINIDYEYLCRRFIEQEWWKPTTMPEHWIPIAPKHKQRYDPIYKKVCKVLQQTDPDKNWLFPKP